jgi:putative hemolysin
MTLPSITTFSQSSRLAIPVPLVAGVFEKSHHATHYPRQEASVPPGVHRAGRYEARFARSAEDLRKVQRLRFEVFNLELSEGLADSYRTGLDQDPFDVRCHHLMVMDRESGVVVGTYRLMTAELGARDELYTSTEFDLSSLPEHVLRHGAEVGRACVAEAHRNGRVLQLLWRGIARYLDWNDKRYVFGCCSVPTLDPQQIAGVSSKLLRDGVIHARFRAAVRQDYALHVPETHASLEVATLPPLFTSYLKLGAKVCGGPALDAEFGVTDYLVVLDLRDVQPRVLANLSAPGLWQTAA